MKISKITHRKKYLRASSIFMIIICISGCKKDDRNYDATPVEHNKVNYADVGNSRIAYKIYGEGFPLVLCMGYSGTMDMWATGVINRLSQKFKLILFDYPGMGLSTTSDTAFTMKGLAEDLNEFMKTLNIYEAYFLGWSMGTYVVQELAYGYPDIVKKMVLYAADFGDTTSIFPSDSIAQILSDPHSTPEELLSVLFPPAWLQQHPDPSEYFPDIIETTDPIYKQMQWQGVLKWFEPGGGMVGRLQSLDQGVLLITGAEDVCTPTGNSLLMADSIPGAFLIQIPWGGHGVMFQFPEIFSNYVITFLEN